jgi:hypothetical protein
MAVYVPEAQQDIERDLQWVTEGDCVATPANFGVMPTASPQLAFHGRNQRFKIIDQPEGKDVQTLDDENRSFIKKFKNKALINIEYDLTDYLSTGDLAWFITLNKTNFASRSYFTSRKPGATEYYRVMKGCVPLKSTISFLPDNSSVHIGASILCTNPQAELTTTNAGMSTPAWAVAIAADLVLPSDGGLDSFDWNSVAYKTKGMDINCEMHYNMVDADDATITQLMIPSRRTIDGNVNIFKKVGADAPHADIFARTLRSMRRVLRPTTGTRIDMTNVDVAEDTQDQMDIRTEGNLKNYVFTAGTIALTAI